jgi:Zn-dependent protease with chaperone function
MDLRFAFVYGLLAFASMFVISVCVVGLQLLPLLWKKKAPWYERARLLWPARTVLGLVQVIGAISFSFQPQSPFALARIFWFIAAFLGALLCGYLFHPLFLARRYSAGSWLKNWLAVVIIFMLPAFAALLVACAGTMEWSRATTVQLLALVCFYIIWLFSGPVPLLRFFKLLTPAPENIATMVREEAAQIGLRNPKSAVVHWHMPNAAALPIRQELLFSTALLEEFSDDEIRAIIRHELGHLTESRTTQVGRAGAFLIFLPAAFVVPIVTSYGLSTLVLAYAVGLGAYLLTLKLSRRMEVRADEIASQCGANEALYAQTLLHLYSRALLPAVLGKRHTTHPDLYDRLLKCGLTPEFPRPKRPPRIVPGLLLIAGIAATIFAAHLSLSAAWRTLPPPPLEPAGETFIV